MLTWEVRISSCHFCYFHIHFKIQLYWQPTSEAGLGGEMGKLTWDAAATN